MGDRYGHNKIPVHCKDCNEVIYKRTDTFKTWSGRCASCYQKNRKDNAVGRIKKRTEVECKTCHKRWQMRVDQLYKWKGYCVDCCQVIKHSTPEQKEKCRQHLSNVRKKYNGKFIYPDKKGEKHWNWQGGKTDINQIIRHSNEYKEWRNEVFKTDNWKCVICGNGGQLVADHIKPFHLFHDLRLDVNNGRTLCVSCDKEYGYNHFRDNAKVIKMDFEIDRKTSWKNVVISRTVN